ncbi:MAG: division/cell wall cluster transcriptional repressor MraZ [Bacteroidales bacterium]|nr:division/cell wall cluster transcriptional repressor MraZ [Bacteroidales bacterium]
MVDLTYTYECKLDNKGRVMLPGKLKNVLSSELSNGFIMKRSVFSKCLELWPMDEWNKKLAEINKLNKYQKKNAKVIRQFLAGVKPLEVDSTGRLNIPNDLMAFAGLSKSVVITSQINILEIWDKDKYEAEVAYQDDDEEFQKMVEEVLGGKTNENEM